MNASSRTLRLLAPLALLLLALPFLAACSGGESEDPEPKALGLQLTSRWLDLLREQDMKKIDEFMAPAFIVARADGTILDRQMFLNNPAKVNSYTIQDDLIAIRDEDLLTVAWSVSVDEVIDGKTVPSAPAHRLSVFQKTSDGWKLLSHANFNAPAR